LDTACARAQALGAHSYRTVAEMLKRRLESAPLPDAAPGSDPGAIARMPTSICSSDHIRGSQYFDKEESHDN
jgi:hypothetical protein